MSKIFSKNIIQKLTKTSPVFVDVQRASEVSGYSTRTIQRFCATQQLNSTKQNGKWKIPVSDLNFYKLEQDKINVVKWLAGSCGLDYSNNTATGRIKDVNVNVKVERDNSITVKVFNINTSAVWSNNFTDNIGPMKIYNKMITAIFSV